MVLVVVKYALLFGGSLVVIGLLDKIHEFV